MVTSPPCLSSFLVETVQSNPQLLMESVGAISHLDQDSAVNETSIPVPVLNWQLLTDSAYFFNCCLLLLFYKTFFAADFEIWLYSNSLFRINYSVFNLYLYPF